MALTDKTDLEFNSPASEVIDLNIDSIKKQRFRINGDSNAIIELNLSDLRIQERLATGLEKLSQEMSKIAAIAEDDDEIQEKMKKADETMCEWLDYIFDSPISEVFSRGGSMYDPINGMFRYEYIIDSLTKLYTDNINDEYKKINARIQKYTQKYIGAKKSSTKPKKKS